MRFMAMLLCLLAIARRRKIWCRRPMSELWRRRTGSEMIAISEAGFFTILRNLWLNQMRKRKSRPQLVDVDGEEGGADLLPGRERNSQEILIGNEDAEHAGSLLADSRQN